MLRPASSRNQRAKGFRLKHALQIGILVAICIWLLYQVKHSHDKKRQYDARNLKMATKAIENQEDFFNFGRKDLTRTEEAATVNMNHKEEESEETQEEEEPEIKQEEEEPEIKQEETEDEEARGAGDDAIDDQDKENADDEAEAAEHVEDPIEEDDKEGQMEETGQSDSQDHEGGTQAREENYKRDDVSSAVVHDTRATESETFAINAKGTDEEQISDGSTKIDVGEDNMEEQEIESENMVNGTVDGSKGDNVTTDGSMNNLSDAMKDNGTMPDGNLANNGTAADSALMSNSTRVEDRNQTSSLTNNTTEAESNSTSISVDQTEGQNNSTVDELPTDVQTSNGTVSSDLARDQNATVDKGAQGEVESNLEDTVEREEKSNSTTVLDSGEQSTTTSSATNRNIVNRAGLGETNDMSYEAMEEERETRTYLSTLPSIKNEAT